jgi:putative nucleotidyltransferase with HDIG domain
MSKTRKITPNELHVGMYVESMGVSWLKHPFLRSSFLITHATEIVQIREAGIRDVWVDDARSVHPSEVIETQSATVEVTDDTGVDDTVVEAAVVEDVARISVVEPVVSEAQLAKKICDAAKEQVASMFLEARLGKAIDTEATLPLVREISQSVQRDSSALISVARLKTHDDYTYLHSVAVCALMIKLSGELGLNEEQTRMAGLAGLMHDIGKAAIPLDILNKPGRLSEIEFDRIKGHCIEGNRILTESNAPYDVQLVSLYHHEKMAGGGYPTGRSGNAIPLLARMGAICDVYDAVTSERSYKRPWDPAHAMREMARWAGHFDARIFSAFVKSVGIYPVGSLVRLESEVLGVVTNRGITSLLKPAVRAFYSLRTNKVIEHYIVDLDDPSCTDKIAGLEDPLQWNFPNLHELWQ